MPNLRLTSIQILRGFAALWVVIYHAIGLVPSGESIHPGIAYVGRYGKYGVDIFFVLSGFVIFYSVHGREMSARDFFLRRAERIVPPYLLLTMVLFIAMLVLPSAFSSKKTSIEHLLSSLAYLSFTRYEFPLLYVGWTLEYEMFFYVLASAGLALGHHCFARLPMAMCATVLGGMLFRMMGGSSAVVTFLASPFILEFGIGMLIASAFLTKAIDKATGSMLLATLILVLWTDPGHRVIVAGMPSAALVCICLAFNGRVNFPSFARVPLTALGDASYSIYLIQVFTLPAAAKLMRPLAGSISPTAITLAEIAMTALAGWAFFKLVESPILNFIRANRSGTRPAPTVAAP